MGGVVKDNLDIGVHDRHANALVQQALALLGIEGGGEEVGEHKADGQEEVALARAVAADHAVVSRVEWRHHRRVAVGLEALDRNALDVHLGKGGGGVGVRKGANCSPCGEQTVPRELAPAIRTRGTALARQKKLCEAGGGE